MSEEKKESGGGLSNLTVRLLTAAVLVPVLIALIAWSRHEGWWGLVFLASALGAAEILGMAVPDPRFSRPIASSMISPGLTRPSPLPWLWPLWSSSTSLPTHEMYVEVEPRVIDPR